MSGTSMLFVSHEATLTGAPMMLLHFLRWLRENSTVEPSIVCLRGGPLAEQFAEVGPTLVLGDEVGWPGTTAAEERMISMGMVGAARRAQRRRVRPTLEPVADAEVVYLNSAASLRILHHLPRVRTAIAHIHELQSAFHWSVLPEDVGLLDTRIDHFVAAADCVADNLVDRYGVARGAITRVYEFIDTGRVLASRPEGRDEVREQLGLPPEARIVGGCGFADWRKGIDLFVQLARAVAEMGRDDVHFVWLGARAGGIEHEQLDFDIAQAGLGDRFHMAGLQPAPFDWYRAFDVFALTSREDPYPLVGLETSLLGVPMVCFDRSGGMVEFITRDAEARGGHAGVVVPYIDVEAMAEAVIDLVDDPGRRAEIGDRAARTVRTEHEVEVAGPQLLAVIERVLGRDLR
jgi:glycosyltransferase involved in cell wall biosynthesis